MSQIKTEKNEVTDIKYGLGIQRKITTVNVYKNNILTNDKVDYIQKGSAEKNI